MAPSRWCFRTSCWYRDRTSDCQWRSRDARSGRDKTQWKRWPLCIKDAQWLGSERSFGTLSPWISGCKLLGQSWPPALAHGRELLKSRFCRFLCWQYDRDVARWTPLYTERWEDTAHERIGCQELRKVLALQMSPEEGDAWYVPHHEVYHPHKPGKIRVVFDCSAKFHGVVTQQHVIQGTWLDKFICWSADKVSLG